MAAERQAGRLLTLTLPQGDEVKPLLRSESRKKKTQSKSQKRGEGESAYRREKAERRVGSLSSYSKSLASFTR